MACIMNHDTGHFMFLSGSDLKHISPTSRPHLTQISPRQCLYKMCLGCDSIQCMNTVSYPAAKNYLILKNQCIKKAASI
jgi:hypothetical protein